MKHYTDAEIEHILATAEVAGICKVVARQLLSERDEARAQRDMLMTTLETRAARELEMLAEVEKQYQGEIDGLRSERDEARRALENCSSLLGRVGEMRDSLRAENERLQGWVDGLQATLLEWSGFKVRALDLVRKKAEERYRNAVIVSALRELEKELEAL